MIVQNIIVGLLLSAGGFFALKYRYRVRHLFPQNNWFERKLGAGATYPLIIALSLLSIFFGFATIFGFADNIFRFVFGPILSAFET